MYEQFYHLSCEPFRLSPDHHFCYRYSQFATIKRYMELGLHRAEGMIMVTGEPGTGKTMLVDDLAASLDTHRVRLARLVSTRMELHELLRTVAFAIGLETESRDAARISDEIEARLRSIDRGGKRVLLIIDEAQHLAVPAILELYRLGGLRQSGSALLQVMLVGQPALRQLIHARGLEEVNGAMAAVGELRPLDLKETRAYVEHRLKIAGWRNDPAISIPVHAIIHACSRGIPRSINLICSRLLLFAGVQQRHQICVADARQVLKELQEEQLYVAPPVSDALFQAEDVFEQHTSPQPRGFSRSP